MAKHLERQLRIERKEEKCKGKKSLQSDSKIRRWGGGRGWTFGFEKGEYNGKRRESLFTDGQSEGKEKNYGKKKKKPRRKLQISALSPYLQLRVRK